MVSFAPGRRMRKIRLKSPLNARLAEHFQRELNDSQRAAVTAPDGYNLILAGPGSGKTRVITYRVAYLIATGVPAGSIMLVTFTRRAAREMVRRMESLIGQQASQVWAGTFHHIGNRLLRRAAPLLGYQPNFTILDSEDQLDLIRLAMDDAGLSGTGKLAPKPAAVQHLISFSANVNRPLAEVIAERSPELVEWQSQIEAVAAAYAERKRAANCMDYDDLLLQWGRLIREFPEQRAAPGPDVPPHPDRRDAGHQRRPGRAWSRRSRRPGPGNLTAVGDDAQSIYRFRGADYDNILRFPERHPGARIFQLDVNYRSTPQIVAFTRASIAHNTTGIRQGAGLRPARRHAAAGRLDRGCLRRGRVHLPADPRSARKGPGARADGRALSQPSRQHPAAGRAAGARHPLHGPQRTSVLRAGPHQGRAGLPADRGQPARRSLVAAAALALAGRRSGQGRGDLPAPVAERPAARGARIGRGDGAAAGQEQGVLRGVRQRPQEAPGDRPGDATRPRRSAPSSREAIRTRSGSSTSGPTTGSPTSSSSPCWPPSTTASNG